jgi:DNA mismatch repair protein MSH3
VLRGGSGRANICRLNVARLANVPKSVIEVAAVKSRELEADIKRRKVGKM